MNSKNSKGHKKGDEHAAPSPEHGHEGHENNDVAHEADIVELPEDELETAKSELAAAKKEAADNYARYLRTCADLDNYRKRSEKEKADAINYANENLVSEILPALDNFSRALEHAGAEENLESLRKGVGMTIDQMQTVLKKYGLEEIKSVGEKFNPGMHHAISHEDSLEVEPDTVVKEFQKGYILKGRLLRPAMVAVAKRPELH